ncbi:hypothetical protein PSECIP111951_02190 [Pseudoalteromonas holothuriae]|uniref:Flagellar Assembly Protein A N-terminal region domain-containing protein n=1 Tax=Pseudoalteromonas holothuriae TaxID=2963714 RepID=A0A9W4W101_9GAMM|nr:MULTISPECIES: FapA family protein [unclassified Pseudoalteromonas]CAH9050973.1 hypothetical protein PSECIP111854_00642 [Pseudoalteromonas sp. CIP111854]CAH9060035.1 hypothetical protein PSECIP111951_02190 [Pseudoalteromonas sp. CIP111951]
MSLFRFDKDMGAVYLLSHPAESGFPASASQLVELLEQSEYADFDIIHANIGKLFTSKDADNEALVIAMAISGEISIKVDENNMIATASIVTARGGNIVSMDIAQKALKDAGVKHGINKVVLEQFLGQQFDQPAGEVYSGIVAHGRRAKNGNDAKFVRMCMTAQDRVLSPQAKEGGKVDMRDLGAIITVKPGAPLMKRIPPTKGETGYTVFGDVLEPKPGRDFEMQVLEGTKLDPNDANILVADAKGVPVAVPRGMRVDDVLCYGDVGVSTGHIEFDGSVIVSGDVKEGMRIKATGDVTVIGFVECAFIESAGTVTILQGAIGRKRADNDAFSCSVKAVRTVSLGYAQYSHIETEQDIFVERQALHCDLSAGRLIRVGKSDNPRGKLIGGKVLNALRIETGELGAPSGTRTRIAIAQNFHELKQKQQEFKSFEKRLSDKVVELTRAKMKATKSPQSTQRDAFLKKIEASEKQLNMHYKRNQHNLKIVQQKLARLLHTCRVKVNELMHPGIEVTIAKDSKQFTRIYPPHSVKLDEGKITQQFTTE